MTHFVGLSRLSYGGIPLDQDSTTYGKTKIISDGFMGSLSGPDVQVSSLAIGGQDGLFFTDSQKGSLGADFSFLLRRPTGASCAIPLERYAKSLKQKLYQKHAPLIWSMNGHFLDDFTEYNLTNAGSVKAWGEEYGTWAKYDYDLFQTIKNTGGGNTFSFVNNSTLADCKVQAKVYRIANASAHRAVGVMARTGGSTTNNVTGYALVIGKGAFDANKLILDKYTGGTATRSTITSTAFTNAADTWYWLRLECVGTSIKGYVSTDGITYQLLIDVTDATHATGKVGIFGFDPDFLIADFIAQDADTRRYDVDISSFEAARTSPVRDAVQFNVKGTCLDGIGYTGFWEPAMAAKTVTTQTDAQTVTVPGTTFPKHFKITLQPTTTGNLNRFFLQNEKTPKNNVEQSTQVYVPSSDGTETFLPNNYDKFVFDSRDYSIRQSSAELNREGSFPILYPGTNNLTLNLFGTSGAELDSQQTTKDVTFAIWETRWEADKIVIGGAGALKLPAISMFMGTNEGNRLSPKIEIWTNSVGAPNAVIANGTATLPEGTLDTTMKWVNFWFTTPPDVTGGVTYWIVVKKNSGYGTLYVGGKQLYDGSTSASYRVGNPPSGSWTARGYRFAYMVFITDSTLGATVVWNIDVQRGTL